MSSPRDRDPFGERPDDNGGWQEPAHLRDGDQSDGDQRDDTWRDDTQRDGTSPERGAGATGEPPAPTPWTPPGWDAPPAEEPRDRRSPVPDAPPAGPEGAAPAPSERPGLFGPRRPRTPGVAEQVFSYQGDLVGAQGWALQQGWEVSDGSAPADAPLAELVAAAPMMRLSKDHRPASVMRGRYGSLEMVAFDVVYASGRYVVAQYAVTAVPLLGTAPRFRLSPARLWKHRVGGMVPLPSGNDAFDLRWTMLAGEDSPQLQRLVQDPAVHQLLLGTDDGDEFWSAAGHVAVVRPDGHRPQLLEHHARLLTAVVTALGVG